MRRLAILLAGLVAGFVLFAFAGYRAILLLTSNTHDGSVEAIMTAVFVLGPLGAIVGAVVAGWMSRARRAASAG